MKIRLHLLGIAAGLGLIATAYSCAGQEPASALPEGVKAVWGLDKAYRESTPSRERVCLNGLWRWQPANAVSDTIPAADWGYFKVPGSWPGITDYMQKDCQTIFAHANWGSRKLGEIATAWYQREFTVPSAWSGRRITLDMEYVNSFAAVWVDGSKAGEIRFPGGEADLTSLCRPGGTHLLSVMVVAMPLKGVMLSYSDTFGAKQVQGAVERRGLCGDVFLSGTPPLERIGDLKVNTSVRRSEIAFEASLSGLSADASYALQAEVADPDGAIRKFASKTFQAGDLKEGRIGFAESWKPEKLWDTHTPQNMCRASLSLLDATGKVLDASLPERFGFREFWIDGRDFYLNGSRIFLSVVPLDNAQVGAAWATYAGAKETFQRLKSFGINFVYTHNYGCEPGTHLGFSEILKAADDEGMLVSFSQPHFGQYQWASPEADRTNGYARHAAFYVRAAQNHPAVVCYSMSHNATGTEEEMNPDLIDGLQDTRNQWSANNAKKALRAEAIVQRLDPGRIVYHHSSGNLGSMHTANFYANFTPIQEMSDWFEHWSAKGVKPLFLCEYGVPIFWDWMMYRGWYKGVRTFGSAQVPWELCLAEWNAQFFGAQAYKLTELEKECLRWEAKQFRVGKLWQRWDYPRNASGSSDFDQRNAVMALYLTDNLRAFRSWGLSAVCPWDHSAYWKLREGARGARQELKVDWDALQRPGFSPDYIDAQMDWINTSYERADWIPTAASEALRRNNMPLLAYIGGKPDAFTGKDHNFYPGETVEKQIIVINNSRQTVRGDCSWSLALPEPVSGSKEIGLETGQQARVPIRIVLPGQLKPGRHELRATVKFGTGEIQRDVFSIDVMAHPAALASSPSASVKIALFDPKGETGKWLGALGLPFASVNASADLSGCDLLIVGKGALTVDGPAPNIERVREGLKVVLFEQTSEVLEKRFGFRVSEYGLRWVFRRVPGHPLLAGIAPEQLYNWRGSATLLPERLKYEMGPRYAPQVQWCGIPVTRAWRAGNRGNVASVLIEKPARGDFMPVLDGGFGLQFSPLMEYREGKGMMVFCQMDVTGRTESDPAAQTLAGNILRYALGWTPSPSRQILYAGNPAGKRQLELSGIVPGSYEGEKLSPDHILVAGAGAGKQWAGYAPAIADFANAGGHILAIGLDEAEANAFLPIKVGMRKAEHIGAFFESFGSGALLAGISPADVHNRDPRSMPLVMTGATPIGDGVLAQSSNVVFCQLAPQEFSGSARAESPFGIDASEPSNLRRTYRRASFLLTRLMANMGAATSTPVLERFRRPVDKTKAESRWLAGFYLDAPVEWDDPYRFFCW
jgi:hypothetical protein